MCSRRLSRVIRMLSAPLAVAFLVILYRESQYNKNNQLGDLEFEFSAQNVNSLVQDGIDAQFLANNLQPGLQSAVQFPDVASNFEIPAPPPPQAAAAVYQPPPPPPPQEPVVNEAPPPAPPVAPVEPAQPAAPAAPPAAPVPVVEQPVAPVVEAPVEPVAAVPVAPESPAVPVTEKPYVKKVMGEVIDHPMMNFDEPENVQVQVKKDDIDLKPPPLKAAMTENKEYRADVSWPTMKELEVSESFLNENADFYKQGMNRQRQKKHGAEIPKRRNPDLIITGAKKCGTTALKIFMNFHNSFQDTPGERHFFNRPSNWAKGYEWYHDSMPLVFSDEVCYEKTPDYFDRPFVPERMSKLENADNVKFVHVLCDPVRRSFSHFNHMFTVQATGQGGVGEAQPGFEFLNANFGDIPREEAFEKTVELAFKNMLGGRDPNDMTDDEIRESINEYYTRWDLPPKDPNRVYPLRIPDAVLGGSLYSIHIRTYLHYFSNENMLYLDATELLENPGLALRRVANFAGVPALIDENNFYFDDAKGYFCMTPPVESGRESFCLGSSKGRTKSDLPDALKAKLRRFYKPFVEDLTSKYSGATYDGWNW